MKCGAATIDITPDWPVELCGYVARVQPSVGVRDPVYGRALFLEGGGGRLLWLHADVIGFERSFRLRLLERLPGFEPREALLTGTHTHSGPATVSLINCGDPAPAYLAVLEAQLIEAARQAMGNAEETRMVAGTARLDVARDRRGQPSAHVNPIVTALGWRREDGSYVAVVTNYGMHNVALSHNNRLISGDVAGEAARLLTERLPGAPAVLATNGACGNINPPAVRDDDALLMEWGSDLADAVTEALEKAEPVGNEIRSAFEELTILTELPSWDAIQETAGRHRKGLEGQSGYVAERIRHAIDRWEGRSLEQLHQASTADRLPMGIHAVSLGGVPIVGMAAEVFSVMTDRLGARVGTPVVVVGYADGDVGYLAPESAYDEGGYEVDGACMFYGTLPIPRGAFERAEALAARMLEGIL